MDKFLFASIVFVKPDLLNSWLEIEKSQKHQKINEFGKVARYKINTQKSLAFLYTNKKIQEKRKQSHLPSD